MSSLQPKAVLWDCASCNVKKNWKESGKKLSEIVDLDIYVKPEEAAVYYVVNKETEGKVEL